MQTNEENNRMGKTRDLFKKIRDTKGTFHAKMGTIKERNGMDLTEAEDIKKRCQEYTEELYKKDLHDPDNHDGVITHLEPNVLECEVKWALGSITVNKASGGDGIPVKVFQILKNDAVKVLHSICQQIRETQQWPQDWKRSVFIPILKKGNAEECSSESEVAQSCLTLCDPLDYSLQGFSVHGILQARILEWVTISFSRGSSQPRDRTQVSCFVGRHFNLWATREATREECSNYHTIALISHTSKVMLKIPQARF